MIILAWSSRHVAPRESKFLFSWEDLEKFHADQPINSYDYALFRLGAPHWTVRECLLSKGEKQDHFRNAEAIFQDLAMDTWMLVYDSTHDPYGKEMILRDALEHPRSYICPLLFSSPKYPSKEWALLYLRPEKYVPDHFRGYAFLKARAAKSRSRRPDSDDSSGSSSSDEPESDESFSEADSA